MKVLAVVLLCAFVAVQGRIAPVAQKNAKSAVALGENPWVVHLRVAVSTSGFLNSGAGSLINNRWVLTSAEAVKDSRFIWIRYGAVNVITPELVTEASLVSFSPDNKLALININRNIEYTDNIGGIGLASEASESGTVLAYGQEEDGSAGETLSAYDVTVSAQEDGSLVAADLAATKYDQGAPLVSDGSLVGVLVGLEDGAGVFADVSQYVSWIEEETGLEFSSRSQKDDLRVKFVD